MAGDVRTTKIGNSPLEARLIDHGPSQQWNNADGRPFAEIARARVMAGEALAVPKRRLHGSEAPVRELSEPDLHLSRAHQICPRWERSGCIDRREATSHGGLVHDRRHGRKLSLI
jgi:hypothetical protein